MSERDCVISHCKSVTEIVSMSYCNLPSALLLRGDMNLSILMTSASTIVGVVAIPGVIKLLSGMFLNPCTDLQVDPMTIIKPLGLTLIPVIVGMAIKNWSTGMDATVNSIRNTIVTLS